MMTACSLPLAESEFRLIHNHLQMITIYFREVCVLCAAGKKIHSHIVLLLGGEGASLLHYALSPETPVILPSLAFDSKALGRSHQNKVLHIPCRTVALQGVKGSRCRTDQR